ncbi:MAG: hypothetical protein AAB966_01975, partial [Patescibacteria group bacterium]
MKCHDHLIEPYAQLLDETASDAVKFALCNIRNPNFESPEVDESVFKPLIMSQFLTEPRCMLSTVLYAPMNIKPPAE